MDQYNDWMEKEAEEKKKIAEFIKKVQVVVSNHFFNKNSS